LAIGDPDAVPAGKYGKAALQALRLWDAVASRLARAENVRAALAFVARGEAPLGIVYETDARAEPKVKIVDFFPVGSHPPIVYPLAATARSKAGSTPAFLAFLRSPAARGILENEGFAVLD
jgi:molybdate transport system substrate-binding protein